MKGHQNPVGLPTILALMCVWLASTWTRADGWLIGLAAILLVISQVVQAPVTAKNSGVLWLVAMTQLLVGAAMYSVLHLFTLSRVTAAVGGCLVVGMGVLIRYGKVAWATVLLLLHSVVVTGLVLAEDPYPVDVYLVHQEAGRLLASRADPYSELEVRNRISEERVTGYPYPPLTLWTYGGLASLGGDPRWVGAFAWLVLVGLLAIRAKNDALALWILAMGSVAQSTPMMLLLTFSELFVAALVVSSYLLFREHRKPWAAVLFGLSFGAKQHLGLALPAAAAAAARPQPKHRLWTTALIAIGAGLAGGAGFLLSPNAYWEATVANLAELQPNLEAASLFGMSNGRISTPVAVAAGLSILAGLFFAARKPARPLRSIAASVGTFLFFGTTTHWTHWTLIGWLLTADLILGVDRPIPKAES